MIVYNTTVKVAPGIEAAWLAWLQQEYIPAIMATTLFSDWKMFRLLHQDEQDGATYVIQYFAPTLQNYQRFEEVHAPRLQQQAFEKWGDQFIAFKTAMQLVN